MAHTISQCLLGACLCSQFCLDELRLLANILLSSRTPENWKCWVLHTYYITCMTKNALSLTTTDYCVTLVQSSELNLLFLIVLLCIAFINHKSDKLPVTVLQLYIYLNCLIHCPHLTRHRPLMWHGPEHFRGAGETGNYGHKQFKTNTECALCFVSEPEVVVVVKVPICFWWRNSIRRQY